MNENKSTNSKVEFVRSFFGRNIGLKKSFPIYLTLSLKRKNTCKNLSGRAPSTDAGHIYLIKED
jgi:hypothetical protein